MIWTPKAMEVLRDASAKAESLHHHEVHPLHLLWAATSRTGMEALRLGKNDHQQAKLRFQVERDLAGLSVLESTPGNGRCDSATPGLKMQELLLRAADLSAKKNLEDGGGRVSMTELLKALLQVDHRTASVVRTREECLV